MFNRFFCRRTPTRLATIISSCPECQGPTAQVLSRVRTFAGLCFVPLVPLPTTYRTTCATCGTAATVLAEQADHLLALAPHVDEPLAREAALAGSSAAA